LARAVHGSTLCDEEEDGGRQFYAFMRGEQLFSREISFTLIVSGVLSGFDLAHRAQGWKMVFPLREKGVGKLYWGPIWGVLLCVFVSDGGKPFRQQMGNQLGGNTCLFGFFYKDLN